MYLAYCIRRIILSLFLMHPIKLLLLGLLLQMACQCNFTHYTFQDWKALYGISYADSSEEALREGLFNAKVVELEKYPYEGCGLTKFAADTPQEISGTPSIMQTAPTFSFPQGFRTWPKSRSRNKA